MNKNIFLPVLFLMSSLLPVAAQKDIMILHTNDTHSCVMPLGATLADTALADRGGFVRRVAVVDSMRSLYPDMLLFDSGDFSQGSPYYTLFKGDVEVGFMNMMKYDAATIGNHEFDFGIDNMVRIFRKCKFPIVCSNYDFTGTPLDGLVKPYIIIKRGGIRFGVFALCPKLDGLVQTKNYGPIKYLDPVAEANHWAAFLKKEKKVDCVICISHLGWDRKGDIAVIKGSRNIDLVLGGHSHTYFKKLEYVTDLDGRQVPVDQNGKHGIYIGELKLHFDKKH